MSLTQRCSMSKVHSADIAIFFAAVTFVSGAAHAETFGLPSASIGNGWTYDPYGRFVMAYQSFDDGQDTTSNIVDMSTSTSRFGFYLKRKDTDDGVSFQFETGLGLRGSSKTSQTNTPDLFGWDRKQFRQVQVIYRGAFGTLRAGQGSMATDSIAELDLGKTTVVAKSNISEMGGSYQFRTTGGALSGIDLGDTFDSFDGDRKFRLRYDTPDWNGFSIAAAYGEEILTSGVDDTFYDVALRYATDLGRLKLSAGLGNSYVDVAGGATDYTTAGSVSVLDKNTGLNLTLASGRDATATQPSYVWAKAGWDADFASVGVTRLYIEGFWGSDYVSAGSESEMWGLGVMQRIKRYNLDVFAGYRVFSFSDTSATQYQDGEALQIGAHITF
ncbi:porin [Shimia thalassica]|uniref:porin n=1 Tax=Shimia thalassica TaxID=1715693 RepID=UPI000C08D5C8|nr:porin [Shimia thalassica]MBU2941579.1 porin [Shimia thalassica]MDO6504040.1 porin [Shimia thalassica]PHO03942.1 porin [Rhodobacteraceae bacterium 4F10]